jgi:hypothetical protein
MSRTTIRVSCLLAVSALAALAAGLWTSPAVSAATAAAASGPLPCVQPLTPTTVLNTAVAPGALVSGKARTVTLPASVPADAEAVVLQVRTKSLRTGVVNAVALGSTAAPTVISAVGTKWASGTAMVVAPSPKLSVMFVGPASSNTQATIEVVGFASAQDCFNGLPFQAAVDTGTGAGLSAPGVLRAGTATPITLQGATMLPSTTGTAFASVAVAAGLTATTVDLRDDSDPANTIASWTVAANQTVRNLEMLPPSRTHQYTLVTSGGSASVSITPQGWFSTADSYAQSSDVVLDSAAGVGAPKGVLTLGKVLTFKIPDDIPSPAAILVSVSAANPARDSTVSVWTAGTTRPPVATLNLTQHRAYHQQILLTPGSSSSFSIRENSGSTSLKASVVGWVPFPAEVNTPVDGITHVTTPDQVNSAQSDPETGDLTVTYTSTDHVDIGDVLVSDATDLLPDGYIGVVTDINQDAASPASTTRFGALAAMMPSSSEVTMQQASLLDAVPSADMDSATLAIASDDPAPDDQPPLPPDDPTGVDPSTPDPTVAPATDARLATASATSTGGQVPGGTTFCSGNAGGWRVGTPLKLSGGVNLTGSWRPGSSTKVNFSFDGNLTGSLSLNVGAAASCSASTTLQGPSLPTIRFMVGPVPVVVRPVLSLKLGVSGSVGGAIKVQTNVDVGLSAGIGYSGGSWSPYFNAHANFPTTVDARLGGSAQAQVAPRLTLMLYGVVGPYVELGGTAQANVNLLRQPWWNASVDLDARAGLVLDVWFFHASFDASRSLYHAGWQATSSYPGPTITTSGLPNGTVGQSYSASLQSSGGATPTSWYLVSGSLPAGLNLGSNGVISGTPTVAQVRSFTVRATSASGYRSAQDKTLSITVGNAPPPTQDYCPNGDYSGSLYDGSCGTPPADYCPNGDFSGSPYDGTCGTAPGGPSISLSQGGGAPVGYWYNVSMSGFTPGSQVTLTCRDSVDPGGFYNQTFTINGAGQASDSTLCYSADHPDHWVTSNTGVQSNHVSW